MNPEIRMARNRLATKFEKNFIREAVIINVQRRIDM